MNKGGCSGRIQVQMNIYTVSVVQVISEQFLRQFLKKSENHSRR